MLERILEYAISQGPAWVVAAVVSYFLWVILKYLRQREERMSQAMTERLQRDELRFEELVKDAQGQLQKMQATYTAQQDQYIQAWQGMVTESLRTQGEFAQCLASLREDFKGSSQGLADIRGLIEAHDKRLENVSRRLLDRKGMGHGVSNQ